MGAISNLACATSQVPRRVGVPSKASEAVPAGIRSRTALASGGETTPIIDPTRCRSFWPNSMSRDIHPVRHFPNQLSHTLPPPRFLSPSLACGSVLRTRYYLLGLFLVCWQTHFQPSANPLNNPTPSKWLTPALPKSYKMFYQNVTHCPST